MEASNEGQAPAPDTAPEASEANPAPEQSPVASAAADAIVGEHGLEQVPVSSLDTGAQDTPVRTSAPPPEAQSGIPLASDRAAGVEPGESSDLPGVAGTASPEEAREATADNSLDPAAGTEAQKAPDHVNPASEGTVT